MEVSDAVLQTNRNPCSPVGIHKVNMLFFRFILIVRLFFRSLPTQNMKLNLPTQHPLESTHGLSNSGHTITNTTEKCHCTSRSVI
jgi:hypothetical protein